MTRSIAATTKIVERAHANRLSISDVSLQFSLPSGRIVTALERISLGVRDQEFFVIVGPSGCGKSSLLRLVAGLMHPTSGTITLDRKTISRPGKDRGMVFQSYTLFPWLTVRQNVEFGLKVGKRPAGERAEIARGYISQVGLQGFEEAYPRQLSGGMMQRVALARALANNPDILLMDEPFGALDSQTRSLMQEMLLSIWEKTHKTVLFITHDIDEAILLGDRVGIMSAQPGRIKEMLDVEIERPRAIDTLTSPRFIALKRYIMKSMHDEALRAMR